MQILGRTKAGVPYRLNEMRGDNAHLSTFTDTAEREIARQSLIDQCHLMIYKWKIMFPEDTIWLDTSNRRDYP